VAYRCVHRGSRKGDDQPATEHDFTHAIPAAGIWHGFGRLATVLTHK
jgi:hypothetical protein